MAQRRGLPEVAPFPEASLPSGAELSQEGSKLVGCLLVPAAAYQTLWFLTGGQCWKDLAGLLPEVPELSGREEGKAGRSSVFSLSKLPLALVIKRQPICLLRACTSPPLTTCYHTHCVSGLSKIAQPVYVSVLLHASCAVQVHIGISPCGCDHA